MEPLDFRRLGLAKSAYTTRFVSRLIDADPHGYRLMTGPHVVPRAGDVVLARVDKLGQHAAIMLPDGRRASLFEGDEILVAYGDRYAPDQFEGEVSRMDAPPCAGFWPTTRAQRYGHLPPKSLTGRVANETRTETRTRKRHPGLTARGGALSSISCSDLAGGVPTKVHTGRSPASFQWALSAILREVPPSFPVDRQAVAGSRVVTGSSTRAMKVAPMTRCGECCNGVRDGPCRTPPYLMPS